MATDKQVDFMKSLYHQLGQEPEDGIEDYNNWEVQKTIGELKGLIEEQKKFNPHEDNCYWY